MFKEQVMRQNRVEEEHEKIADKLYSLDNTNQMLDQRTISHTKMLEKVSLETAHLKETKQDKSNFMEQKM